MSTQQQHLSNKPGDDKPGTKPIDPGGGLGGAPGGPDLGGRPGHDLPETGRPGQPARPGAHPDNELPETGKPGKPEPKRKGGEGETGEGEEEVPISEDPTLSPNEKVSRARGF
jgi:hypothetical protein